MDKLNIKTNISRANSINNYSITDFCNNIDECDERMAEKVEMFNEELTLYLPGRKRCSRFCEYANLQIWIYLIITATIAAFFGATQNKLGGTILFNMRLGWAKSFESNQFLKFLIFWVTMFAYAFIATGILGLLAPTAAGSGVPPLKSVLGGVHIYKFLHWKILVAKYFGLQGTLASGVGSGKEGPMIHMSAMIAYNLGYLPWFKDVISDPYRKKLLLNAAVACGVTSTFGAPYGAMVFSIELCSTVFLVSSMWKLFVTATVVKIWYDFYFWLGWNSNISAGFVYDNSQSWTNFPHYILIGIICGWMASLWLFLFSQFLQFKAQVPFAFVKNRYFYVFMMTIIIALLQFWLTTSWKGNKGLLNSLWAYDILSDGDPNTFPANRVWEEILATIVCRWVMIMCFATMPIPAGIALPSITQGAFIGRFYGEILRWYIPQVQPQAFSIVGAAAFGGCMTRATSITLLIVELTGQKDLIIGIITANMFAYSIANLFTMSAFNTAMTIGKMPYLPFMFYSQLYKQRVGEHMEPCVDFIPETDKLCDIVEHFANKEIYTNDEFVPIVETEENKKIVGSVRSWDMLEYIKLVMDAIKKETEDGNCDDIIAAFGARLETNDQNPDHKKIFCLMTERMKEWIDVIRKNEAKLAFNNGCLSNEASAEQGSAIKEQWVRAFDKVREGTEENGSEYYLFADLILSRMTADWENPTVKFNSYPICVDANTKLVKVHFLFQMLGTGAIFIAKRGKFEGKLTLSNFLNLRYTKQTYA